MTKIQEPKIVQEYRQLFCELLGERNSCEVNPVVVHAPGGLIVAVDVKKHTKGEDPEVFGREIYQRMVAEGVDVELVEGGDDLNLVAYLDGKRLPRKKAVGMIPAA